MRPVIVFGDVHGESAKLAHLLRQVRGRFGLAVDIYSLGDLIDRGPDSKGVLDLCIEENVMAIAGNHELWAMNAAAGHGFTEGIYTKMMGGIPTLRSYGLERGDPDVGQKLYEAMGPKQRRYLLDLPAYRRIEVGPRVYWLIHCGLSSDTVTGIAQVWQGPPLEEDVLVHVAFRAMKDTFFWMTPKVHEPKRIHRFNSGAVQLFGHIPVPQPVVQEGHFFALDTGCGTCPPHTLTGLILHPDGRREFIKSR